MLVQQKICFLTYIKRYKIPYLTTTSSQKIQQGCPTPRCHSGFTRNDSAFNRTYLTFCSENVNLKPTILHSAKDSSFS